MSLKDLVVISPGTKKVLAITLSVALLAVIFAFFYYRGVNRSEDPRVAEARALMTEYDHVSGGSNSYASFHLLDSAGEIYSRVPGYETSWERGVIYNNKCSGLLMMALYDSTITVSEKNTLLDLAISYSDSSISVYTGWLAEWEDLSEESVAQRLHQGMNEKDPAFAELDFHRIFRKRVNDVMLARIETPRRLSVSLSNKATAYRHLLKQDSALGYYEKALALWEENHAARSNLCVLLGGEPLKRGIIKSLFPPDRRKR